MDVLGNLGEWAGMDGYRAVTSAQRVISQPRAAMAAVGAACGAADPDKKEAPASACGAADPEKPSAACGTACGAADPEKPTAACGTACGAADPEKP